MRPRSLSVITCAGALLFIPAQPAAAISDGVPDTEHPNVGALLLEVEPGVVEVACSGVLLSPRHFLTAAHCLEGVAPEDLAVTFDQDALTSPATVAVLDHASHPRAGLRRSIPYDLGVVTLAEPVTAVVPIELPAEGFLDDAAARGDLRGHHFVNVGYGWIPNDRGQPGGTPPGLRMTSTSPFMALTRGELALLMRTDATGPAARASATPARPSSTSPSPARGRTSPSRSRRPATAGAAP